MSWRLTSEQHPADVAVRSRPSIIDEFLESYVLWREASDDVRTAHEHWHMCARHRRQLAFERYRAALDWEEHAARIYSDWTERLRALGRETA
jgi:hypothetical protein